MTQADLIRDHVLKAIISPARADGVEKLTVRAGDVHDGMRLSNSYPAVCSVLGGMKLATLAGVAMIDRDGPRSGANVYFKFDLRGSDYPVAKPPGSQSQGHRPVCNAPRPNGIELSNALVLVSCSKSKLTGRMAARDLYGASASFRMKRTLVERAGARWMILSAKYGLLDPDAQIENYERTLTTLSMRVRREWASSVLITLLPVATQFDRVVILAGQTYSQFLVPALRDVGCHVDEPLIGLTQGRQLAWLVQQQ